MTDPPPSEALFQLPGLDGGPASPGALTTACRATLAALARDGLLEDRHTATAALLLALAESIDQLTRYGGTRKGTPLALLAREMREALSTLPEPTGRVDEAWSILEQDLRRAAAVRDPQDP